MKQYLVFSEPYVHRDLSVDTRGESCAATIKRPYGGAEKKLCMKRVLPTSMCRSVEPSDTQTSIP